MNSENSSGSKKKKIAASAIAVALAAALMIGGTFSYFSGSTETLVNLFNANTNGVTITETENDYEIIPGTSQTKDPTVTATATLDSYVYLVVEDNTDGLVGYDIDTDVWTLLYSADDEDNTTDGTVYYAVLSMTETSTNNDGNETTTEYSVREVSYNVLKNQTVSYSASLTNEDMWEATTTTETTTDDNDNETTSTTTTYSLKEGITLSFTAYIIQQTPFEVYDTVETTDEDGNTTTTTTFNQLSSAKYAFNWAYGTYVTASDADDVLEALEDPDVELVVLDGDVTLTEQVNIGNSATSYYASPTSGEEPETVEKTLDLNGYDLTVAYTSTAGATIRVEYGADLTITDSSTDGSGTLTTQKGSYAIYVGDDASVTLESGTISGCSETRLIYLPYNTSSFTMNGGTISGNSTTYGGAVNVAKGSFTMNGGTISGNSATYGGAIYLSGAGTVSITGGTISGNSANYGGAINVSSSSSGTVTISGGTITGNSTTQYGGAVYAQSGTVTITGGTIANNTASVAGDDISTKSSATLSITTDNVNTGSITYGSTEITINGWYNDESNSRYSTATTSTAVTNFTSGTAYNIVAAYDKTSSETTE